MTEYIAQCRHDADEYIRAEHNGVSVVLVGYEGEASVTAPYLTPDAARTFARGIIALADEIDGGEVEEESQPAPLTVGEPEAPSNPRLTYLHQAEVALTEYEHTAADIIALARFLAGE